MGTFFQDVRYALRQLLQFLRFPRSWLAICRRGGQPK